MKYYITTRNTTIRARNHELFVTKLRKSDSERWACNETFMRAYADRRKLYNNVEINCANETVFVQTLISHGLIKIQRKRGFFQSALLIPRR